MLEDRVMVMPIGMKGGRLAGYEIPSFQEMLSGEFNELRKWKVYSKGLLGTLRSQLKDSGFDDVPQPTALSASAEEMTGRFLTIMKNAKPDSDSSKYSDVLFGDDISELDEKDSDSSSDDADAE